MYDSHDEVYYVLRRADGTPVAVPAWMTRPEAAHAKIVSTARLPVRVLLELRRVIATCCSSSLALPSQRRQVNPGLRASIMYERDGLSYMKEVLASSGLIRML